MHASIKSVPICSVHSQISWCPVDQGQQLSVIRPISLNEGRGWWVDLGGYSGLGMIQCPYKLERVEAFAESNWCI